MTNKTDNELQEIYRLRVLEHSREPHNCKELQHPSHQAEGHNPLCGDKVTIYLKLANGLIQDAAFEGTGCAISIASASMMTDALPGHSADDSRRFIRAMQDMLDTGVMPDEPSLQEAKALQGVRNYRSRIKCALLPWNTAESALNNNTQIVSTEG